MNIDVRAVDVSRKPGELLVVWGFLRDRVLDEASSLADQLSDGAISAALAVSDFRGKLGEKLVVYPCNGVPAKRLLLVGLGHPEAFNLEAMREGAAIAAREARRLRATDFVMTIPSQESAAGGCSNLAEAQTIGTRLALYRYEKNTLNPSDEDEMQVERVTLESNAGRLDEVLGGVEAARAIAEAACFVRTWINHPSNVATADAMELAARAMAERTGMTCTILDQAALREQAMGLLLAVGQGAKDAPRMILLEHAPENRTDPKAGPVVLVGKGVLFDTGGYTLKPRDSMIPMNTDMAGAAVVLGVMEAISRLKLPVHVMALAPIVENLIGPYAYKPSEVFFATNGKSVEIRSTDAEGRLVLADALCYADGLGPSVVIDVATLTGSKNVALGPRTNALFASNDDLAESLLQMGERSGEPLWRMPLDPAYDRQLKSQVADLVNTDGRLAGAITAARFLSQFVGDWPWAHIDIAGSARYAEGPEYTPRSYLSKGGTDIPMRTLVEFIREVSRGGQGG